MPTIKDALDIIGKLTVAEQESLKTMLLSPAFVKSLNIEDFVAKERFANGRVCPLCGCIHVVRNGHRKDGTQRYVCKDCGKSFVIATNSIVSGTRKDLSVWEQYIDCMMNGLSIRKTAVACGIHRNTAFLWRHKILDALQNMADDVTLDGIIEADETFFAISYKGNHSKSKTFAMPRKAHMRGFNGVSTKYLNNYLVWNNLVNYAKESDMEKRNIFLTFVLATLKTAKCRDLSNRPAVPLVA